MNYLCIIFPTCCQLLGLCPQTSTGALSLDPAGDFRSQTPNLSTPGKKSCRCPWMTPAVLELQSKTWLCFIVHMCNSLTTVITRPVQVVPVSTGKCALLITKSVVYTGVSVKASYNGQATQKQSSCFWCQYGLSGHSSLYVFHIICYTAGMCEGIKLFVGEILTKYCRHGSS